MNASIRDAFINLPHPPIFRYNLTNNNIVRQQAFPRSPIMFNYTDLAIAFFIALITTFLLTFPVKKLAIKLKAVDLPNYRKIHKKVTPRIRSEERRVGKECRYRRRQYQSIDK